MATATVAETRGNELSWSPARLYLVISGAILMLFAIAGFAINRAFPIGAGEVGAAETDHIFGVLETNGWHNLAGLISALVAFGFARKPRWARIGAMLKGTFYVGVTTAIAIWGPETFWIAANAPDQFVHAGLGIGGLATAWLTHGTDTP